MALLNGRIVKGPCQLRSYYDTKIIVIKRIMATLALLGLFYGMTRLSRFMAESDNVLKTLGILLRHLDQYHKKRIILRRCIVGAILARFN